MAECKTCGELAYMPFTCSRCGGRFCTKHRVNHECNKTADVASETGAMIAIKITINNVSFEAPGAWDVDQVTMMAKHFSLLKVNKAAILFPVGVIIYGLMLATTGVLYGAVLLAIAITSIIVLDHFVRTTGSIQDVLASHLVNPGGEPTRKLCLGWKIERFMDISLGAAWMIALVLLESWIIVILAIIMTLDVMIIPVYRSKERELLGETITREP